MTSNVITTRMVVAKNESTGKECTRKKYDAFVAKPMMSLLDKVFDKSSSDKTDAKPSRSQKTNILNYEYESIIADNKSRKIEKDDKKTTGVLENERSENILKTSKNYRKNVSKICSNIEDALLVERIIEKNKPNCNANSRDLNSKRQKLGKKRIKYTKLYDLTEIPERSNIDKFYVSRSSNAQEKHASPQEVTADRPELFNNFSTVMNKKEVDKSSVEPIAPVDTKIKEDIDAPVNSLEKKPTTLNVKAKSEIKNPKKSKNQRKKISIGCSRDIISNDYFNVKIATSENKTNLCDSPKTSNIKTQNAGKRRIKYTKLYDLTEIPEKSDIRSCCTPISSNVQEKHVNPRGEIDDRSELINSCSTIMNKKVVDKSSVEPIAPVDTTKKKTINAPGNSIENKSTALDVKTKKSENRIAKKSKNQRKKMSKRCSRDVISNDSLNVKIATSKNNMNLIDPPKTFNAKTQNAGKRRIKYTKLYDLTEIPEKSDTRCTPTSSDL